MKGAGGSKGSQSSKQVGRGTGGAVHPSLEARGEPCKHQGCSPAPSLALGSTWAKGRIPTGSSCPSAAHPCPALLIPVPGERERTGKGTGQKDQIPWGQHQPHPHITGASPRRKRGMMFSAEHGGSLGTQGAGGPPHPGAHKRHHQVGKQESTRKASDRSSPWKQHSNHLEEAPAPSSCCWKGGRWQAQGSAAALPTLLPPVC